MAVLRRFEISTQGGGVLKDRKIGLRSIDQDGDDYVDETPTMTCDLSGITYANIRLNDTDEIVGSNTYRPNTVIIFDIIAASNATLGDGHVIYRYVTVNGNEVSWKVPLTVTDSIAHA